MLLIHTCVVQALLPESLDTAQLQLLLKQEYANSEENATNRRLRNALISEADDLQPYQLQTEDQHSSGNIATCLLHVALLTRILQNS